MRFTHAPIASLTSAFYARTYYWFSLCALTHLFCARYYSQFNLGVLRNYTAGKPWTESINQSIGCQICCAKGRQPRFNVQVALHSYVNKIIRDTVPQKNLLGNVEITVIRVFLYLSQAND